MLDRSFRDGREAIVAALNGGDGLSSICVDVRAASGLKGRLYVSCGNIDWAVCEGQSVALKGLLIDAMGSGIKPEFEDWGLGRGVKMDVLRSLIERRGGDPQAVLSRCINGHVTSALRAMAEFGAGTLSVSGYTKGNAALSASGPWETLVGVRLLRSGVLSGQHTDAKEFYQGVANTVGNLPKVIVTLVFDNTGCLRASYGGGPHDRRCGALLEEIIGLDCIGDVSRFGDSACQLMEHEEGIVMRQRVATAPPTIVVLLVERTGRVGVIKHRIENLAGDGGFVVQRSQERVDWSLGQSTTGERRT